MPAITLIELPLLSRTRRMRRSLLIAVLLVASMTVTLALAEIGLRAIGRPQIEVGWGLNEQDLEALRKAYRAQLARAGGRRHLRVLLLGDSQVTNMGTPPGVLPATLLEEAVQHALSSDCPPGRGRQDLGVMVFALGQTGWGQDQELLALDALIGTVRPHLVVNWFTPENDLWNNAFPTHYPRSGTPKPTFVVEHDRVRQTSKDEILPGWTRSRFLTASKIASDRIERRLRGVGANAYFSGHFPLPFDPDGTWERAHLPPVSTARTSATDDETPYLSQFNPYFEMDPIDLEKSHFVIGMNPQSPRIDYMVRLTAALIRKIQISVKQAGADYAAFYYSADTTNQPLYPPDGTYHARGYEFVFSHRGMHERLEEIFDGIRRYEIPLLDKDWRMPHNDPHLTTPANRHVLESLARLLVDSGLACALPSD